MPSKNDTVTPVSSGKQSAAQAFKFEVSAGQLFHFKAAVATSALSFDAGLGDYSQKLSIPVPQMVQNINGTVYGYVAPYAEWGYNRLLKKKVSE